MPDGKPYPNPMRPKWWHLRVSQTRRDILGGESIPPYYRTAYWDVWHDTRVCYPIGIHLIGPPGTPRVGMVAPLSAEPLRGQTRRGGDGRITSRETPLEGGSQNTARRKW